MLAASCRSFQLSLTSWPLLLYPPRALYVEMVVAQIAQRQVINYKKFAHLIQLLRVVSCIYRNIARTSLFIELQFIAHTMCLREIQNSISSRSNQASLGPSDVEDFRIFLAGVGSRALLFE